MTRIEAEVKILGKMKEIVEICKQYDPDFKYITLFYDEGFISFNNTYWNTDKKLRYQTGGGETENE